MKKPILILGTRSFAQEVADIVAQTPDFAVAGFVANLPEDRPLVGSRLEGKPVHWIDDLASLTHDHQAVIGMGTTQRLLVAQQAQDRGLRFATIVHPSAQISPQTRLGPGVVIHAGVIIASHSELEPHVMVNRGALIGHHTQLASFATVGPGVNIAGHCRIETQVYLGIGAIVSDHVAIGAGSVIGAGAVVVKDLPAQVLAVGVPAKIIKENIQPR